MSSHGRDEFDGHNADSTFDEELTGDEYASNDGGVPVAGGEAGAEEEEGLLLPNDGHGGGDSGGTKESSGSRGSGGDVECPECGKFFKNDKSMFGHLRSHPKRGYKGATPPIKKLKMSSDTPAAASPSFSSPDTDRPPAHHSGLSGRDHQLSPLEIMCAYAILTLKYRGNDQAAQKVPPPPLFARVDAIGQAEGGIRGSVTGNAAAEFKCNAGAEAGNLGNCAEHGDSIVKIPKKRRNMPKEVREAHRKKAKLVPTPKEKRPYVCKHCKAEFPTNQALGGHVAGHHREKKVPRLNDSSGMATESHGKQQQVKGGGDHDNGWRDNDLSLRRGLLSEQFSMALNMPWQSGQASGGQMSQHSERSNNGQSPVVAAPTPTTTPTEDGETRRLWNIDLNVEAQEQE
ncbi:hypothetical protein BAE44_0022214 [Dichanthelium oligosanthes]|uniref:C2H2-type domain-containing protein n=1 Tax=Dichanthelium oligosanthes TaxID=888268 RepID=A0A1E5UV69_9POAL|nr:hypothetical protein BAE44_0022214 [Dichanthelium oligosanthes]